MVINDTLARSLRVILTVLVALILLPITAHAAYMTLAAFGGAIVLLMFSDAPNSSVWPLWPILLQFVGIFLLNAPVALAWVLLFSRWPFSALALGIVGAFGWLYLFKKVPQGIFALLFL
jgi:hypothetical protein